MRLLTLNNPKTQKGYKMGYITAILHLAPYNLSGFQVCPHASAGCSKACLNTAGRGQMGVVQKARIRRTKLFFGNKGEFMDSLIKDIEAVIRKADREDKTPTIRLNGTSDIPWERVYHNGSNIFEMFPDVIFYDYTKRPGRTGLPENYSLTFSRSESNEEQAKQAIKNEGINVAVVFADELPNRFWGFDVIDGDKHDLRFLDPRPSIVGLLAKGKAKKDISGFVIQPHED